MMTLWNYAREEKCVRKNHGKPADYIKAYIAYLTWISLKLAWLALRLAVYGKLSVMKMGMWYLLKSLQSANVIHLLKVNPHSLKY